MLVEGVAAGRVALDHHGMGGVLCKVDKCAGQIVDLRVAIAKKQYVDFLCVTLY